MLELNIHITLTSNMWGLCLTVWHKLCSNNTVSIRNNHFAWTNITWYKAWRRLYYDMDSIILLLYYIYIWTPVGEFMISPFQYMYILHNRSVLGLCLRINYSGLISWISLITLSRTYSPIYAEGEYPNALFFEVRGRAPTRNVWNTHVWSAHFRRSSYTELEPRRAEVWPCLIHTSYVSFTKSTKRTLMSRRSGKNTKLKSLAIYIQYNEHLLWASAYR